MDQLAEEVNIGMQRSTTSFEKLKKDLKEKIESLFNKFARYDNVIEEKLAKNENQ